MKTNLFSRPRPRLPQQPLVALEVHVKDGFEDARDEDGDDESAPHQTNHLEPLGADAQTTHIIIQVTLDCYLTPKYHSIRVSLYRNFQQLFGFP